MRTKQSQANDSHRQKPQEHREATTIKAKSTGNESHRSHGSNENQNFQHQKETTRVLHPASRLTPENGGIPPFYRVC
jgi:hypothetical protein